VKAENQDDKQMARSSTSADVTALLTLVADLGFRIWLDGGWGVDALLGEQTREHGDIDIVIEKRNSGELETALHSLGYLRANREHEREWNFILLDQLGHQVDFHVIELDAEGNGIYGPKENGEQYPADCLTGKGTIEEHTVSCIKANWMVEFHTGYEVDDTDWMNVKALCEKFGIPIPEDYHKWARSPG
jgi:lincosamide nucleotidyltransferase A/C/D/E